MLKEIIESDAPITQNDLDEFSQRYGVNLPASYRKFLLRSNGGRPIPDEFPIVGFTNNPKGTIQAFFGLNTSMGTEDLNSLLQEFHQEIPQGVLPIACTGTGDYLCLDVRRQPEKILLWDFHSFWGNNVWDEHSLYPVADSFEALCAIIDGPGS